MINALTDFFSHPAPQKSDFLSFQSERKRVQTNMDRSDLSQTRIQNILLAGEGWNSSREDTLKFSYSSSFHTCEISSVVIFLLISPAAKM